MGTGLIYAAIVAVWAAYLVPLWLRRHDEESASRSVDRFSTAMKALASRQAGAETGADTSETGDALSDVSAAQSDISAVAGREISYPPGISAATRRRRALVGLLVPTTISLLLAVIGFAPWWLFGVLGAMVIGFLGVSASIATRERSAPIMRPPVSREAPISSTAAAPDASESAVAEADAPPAGTVYAELPEDFAAPKRDADSWDPVEVLLPAYVTKAKAEPPARRTDLGESAAGEMLLDESESERESTGIQDELYDRELDGDFGERRRAVGD